MTATSLEPRASLNRGWRRVLFLGLLFAVLTFIGFAMRWERSWYVTINWTQSLSHWAFIVDKNAEPVIGDYVDFYPPENPYYQNINFVKLIVAGPGDEVVCRGRAFLVDGAVVAIAKTHSQAGDPLVQGPCGTVPAGHYFVIAPHKDSFDSRYKEIGHVAQTRVRGVARPIL
ncbi:MAG: S26 family signal peptidase [Pseudomonadota bacterium]